MNKGDTRVKFIQLRKERRLYNGSFLGRVVCLWSFVGIRFVALPRREWRQFQASIRRWTR